MEDPMPILERLPYLTILVIDCAYDGKKMVCSTGGFPNLEILIFDELYEFNEWEIQEGAMPTLSKLTIVDCSLSTFPELQNVTSLQELLVSQYTSEQKTRLLSMDLYKIKHIPYVRFEKPVSYCKDYDDYEDSDDDKDGEDDEDNEDGEHDEDDEGNNDEDDEDDSEDDDEDDDD